MGELYSYSGTLCGLRCGVALLQVMRLHLSASLHLSATVLHDVMEICAYHRWYRVVDSVQHEGYAPHDAIYY